MQPNTDGQTFASGITSTTPTVNEPEPEYGEQIATLFTSAASSDLKGTQALGVKVKGLLDDLASRIKKEQRLAELAAEIARVRNGGE